MKRGPKEEWALTLYIWLAITLQIELDNQFNNVSNQQYLQGYKIMAFLAGELSSWAFKSLHEMNQRQIQTCAENHGPHEAKLIIMTYKSCSVRVF